jgi:hypothetical protein
MFESAYHISFEILILFVRIPFCCWTDEHLHHAIIRLYLSLHFFTAHFMRTGLKANIEPFWIGKCSTVCNNSKAELI